MFHNHGTDRCIKRELCRSARANLPRSCDERNAPASHRSTPPTYARCCSSDAIQPHELRQRKALVGRSCIQCNDIWPKQRDPGAAALNAVRGRPRSRGQPSRARSRRSASTATIERPAVLADGRCLRVDPLDRAGSPPRRSRPARCARGRAPAATASARARSAPRAPQLRSAPPCPTRSRAAPSRRCAASDGPSPTPPPRNRPRAAAARPGTAGPRRRRRPSPRGSGARRGSPSCARSAAGPRRRGAADSWSDRTAPATGELTRSAATVGGHGRIDGRPVYSATDLVGFLACEHLTELERAAAGRPRRAADPRRPRARRHPQARLRARGALPRRPARPRARVAVEIEQDGSIEDRGDAAPRAAAARRSTAMAAGARRHLPGDVLRRDVARPRGLPAPRRRAGATVALGSVPLRGRGHEARPPRQGQRGPPDLLVRRPAGAHPGRPARVDARRARRQRPDRRAAPGRRLHGLLPQRHATDSSRRSPTTTPATYPPAATYPEPVEHCDVCRWAADARRAGATDDHLCLVAGIAARQRRALSERGVDTLEALGDLRAADRAAARGHERRGARAGSASRRGSRSRGDARGSRTYELLLPEPARSIEPERGLASLPPPSPGDLFFDIEGDPFALDDGLDYLFGVLDDRTSTFHAIWARDDAGEVTLDGGAARVRAADRPHHRAARRAIRRCTSTTTRRTSRPRSSASWAATARARTRSTACCAAACSSTCCASSARALRASVESYSIKRLEPLYGFDARGRPARRRLEHRRVRGLAGARRGRAASGDAPRPDRALQPRRRRQQPAPARLAGGAARRARGADRPRRAASGRPRRRAAGRARPRPRPGSQALVERLADRTSSRPTRRSGPRSSRRAGCSASSSAGIGARTRRSGGSSIAQLDLTPEELVDERRADRRARAGRDRSTTRSEGQADLALPRSRRRSTTSAAARSTTRRTSRRARATRRSAGSSATVVAIDAADRTVDIRRTVERAAPTSHRPARTGSGPRSTRRRSATSASGSPTMGSTRPGRTAPARDLLLAAPAAGRAVARRRALPAPARPTSRPRVASRLALDHTTPRDPGPAGLAARPTPARR